MGICALWWNFYLLGLGEDIRIFLLPTSQAISVLLGRDAGILFKHLREVALVIEIKPRINVR
ncbi:hypothetical protein D3C85_1904520 [compost metagenome]